MATKYYGINDKWTDDDIENVIEVASEDGSVDSVKVNGVEYGGGGGGLQTISLTVNYTPGAIEETWFDIHGYNGGQQATQSLLYVPQLNAWKYNPSITLTESGSTTYTLLLMADQTEIAVDQGTITSVSGSIIEESGVYYITGDCTVNITGTDS